MDNHANWKKHTDACMRNKRQQPPSLDKYFFTGKRSKADDDSPVSGEQQYFRIQPRDVKVHEGSEAMLECEVTHLAGQVQWTKDGFALGFSKEIPGFPRYSVIGDSRNGVYNLRIVNATLDDDAEYQCQVGPARFHKAIRANARLNVISPPSSIEIVNHPANSKIEIRENQDLELECQVKNSKPKANIVWYRGNVELKLDKRWETTSEVAIPNSRAKRFDVKSRIKLTPTAEDDYADYTCEARHEALPPDMPMRVTVQLSVLYPPGVPYIEGYTEGEIIRRGQTLELVCRSRGGNPPAQLIWYKNGEQIRMAYRTAGRLSENMYTFTADASDNKAHYRCEASNIMSPAPLKADIQLTVLFAPSQVSISGPTEAKVGDLVPLTCTTANSNPPAEVKWMVGGRHIRNATSRVIESTEGGSITTSNITVLVTANRRSLVVICHGLNMQLTENVVSTHTINVLYPPGEPIIHGFTDGVAVSAGTVQKISCISTGGNPLATLTWYKNDKKINSVRKVTDRSVSAEVTILTNVTDNEAVYKCEASNSATEIPLFETITLSVHFPPEHVVIRKDPEKLTPGSRATLTCDSSSSNPEAVLSWYKDGIAIPGVTNMTRPGLHGGKVSSILLHLDITPEMNGVRYTCQATNTALQRSVVEAIVLDVHYKPIFEDPPTSVQMGVEGQPLILALQARANPANIAYTWTKDGNVAAQKKDTRVVAEGPILNITNLHKDDAGIYTCEAVNSEGSTRVTVNITVQYAAVIKDAPKMVMVSPGEDAQLACTAQGNPLNEAHFTWTRKGLTARELDQRTTKTFKNGTSFLLVHKPKREDNGPYTCIVNNNIGNESSRSIHMIVKYKPEIDMSPSIAKAASNTGDTGILICRASGAPAVRFKWSREGSPIPVNTTEKYFVEVHQNDLVTYESKLHVKYVRPTDYGNYECEARNNISFSTTTVKLEVTTAPDPPSYLRVTNYTHDSVSLSWVPGFNGGMEPTFRLRYRPTNVMNEGYHYIDVTHENASSYTITGLAMDTDYTFSIMAFNKLGGSKYLPDTLRAKTLNQPPEQQPGIPDVLLDKADIPRLVIIGVSITGALLVLLNVALVVCFILRKRKKRMREAASEQSSSKSATIEMYAPSSYNETVTGETLSSVSEKSESYSNGDSNQEYLEEGTKAAASTYLIDKMEYPYQYPTYEMQHQPKQHHEEAGESRNTYNHTVEGNKVHYNNIAPAHTVDGPYYNISPDARYIPYPPQMEFGHMSQPVNTGSLRRPQHRGAVVPPDVTVSHNPPPHNHAAQNGPSLSTALTQHSSHPVPPAPLLSTFNPGLSYPAAMETEGHLV